MMDTLTMTQPKQSSGGGGKSREEVVNEKCAELSQKMPADFVEDEYSHQIKRLGGLGIPLNIFLFQEVQRLQKVIKMTREDLLSLQLAIKGEVVMTEQLQAALNDIYDAKVPHTWLWTPGGDQASWLSPTLGLWFTVLLERDLQNRTWLQKNRPASFWMTGFFNAQGFLTSMKQEVARAHRSEQWALDDMEYISSVTEHEHLGALPKKGADEGVFVHGLYLDGAAWQNAKNRQDRSLVEAVPKVLFAPLPVIHVSAVARNKKPKDSIYGPNGPYMCPCYKYPKRTYWFFIFSVALPPGRDFVPSHWCLRGVALLCSTD